LIVGIRSSSLYLFSEFTTSFIKLSPYFQDSIRKDFYVEHPLTHIFTIPYFIDLVNLVS